jgi:MFS family permease
LSLPDFLLEASRVLIGLGLAVFIGVPVALLVGGKKKIFLEREERRGTSEEERLGRARFVAAGALLVGVLLEVQVMGSALPPRHVWRAGAIFLLLAALVSAVMVVLPRERYYREKSLTFEENLRPPWASRAAAAQRRAARLDFFGFLLALAALVLG